MSTNKLLRSSRPYKYWTETARFVYTTRRFITFFDKNPIQIHYLLEDSDNILHWEALFRFFFRRFPESVDTKIEFGKEVQRPWYHRTESWDPIWDKFLFEYRALQVHKYLKIYYSKE